MVLGNKDHVNVIAFSQNLKLESFVEIKEFITNKYPILFISTHELFENEKMYVNNIFDNEVTFRTFASFFTDEKMASIDAEAYKIESSDTAKYYEIIKKNKNEFVIEELELSYYLHDKLILSDDLGFYKRAWIEGGYNEVYGRYYYQPTVVKKNNTSLYRRVVNALFSMNNNIKKEIYCARYNGTRYVFLGSMNRVNKRIDLEFKKSILEHLCLYIHVWLINKRIIFLKTNTRYVSSLHEFAAWNLPEHFPIALLQDGYLPPNYSSMYLKTCKLDVFYYVWDDMSSKLFINQGINYAILPFRKKVFLPYPSFSKQIRKVLVATSGAGDWTAMKNRSDEDRMVIAIAQIAKRHADIEFIYRCHPVWLHPSHQGVNSISRVIEYFEYLNLPNLKVSCNIPEMSLDEVKLSLSPTSLEKDMEGVDLIMGEHSVSMLDGALKGIPFVSINLTGRRDFFSSLTEMGFPHCETLNELEEIFESYTSEIFCKNYLEAIDNYNDMMNIE